MMRRVLLLGPLWLALAAAAPQPLPVELPPPDLTFLVRIAAAPLDKPPVSVPEPPAPESPYLIPELPPPPLILDPSIAKAVAPLPPSRCSRLRGDILGSASAVVECGRAEFEKGEYRKAVEKLQEGLGKYLEHNDARAARYWLAEALYQLNRVAEADREFEQVYREGPRDDLAAFSLHSSGWTALRLGETARALDAFEGVLKQPGGASESLLVSARRGRAVALSLLGRHDEARQAWAKLLGSSPPSLAREALFWLGESLGRLGQFGAADEQLTRFATGGPHPLLNTGLLRLGWWRSAAGRAVEAVKAYRSVLANAGVFPERDWAELGLVLGLLGANDWTAAREAVKPLQERSSPLAMPALFQMAQWVATRNAAAAHAFDQELLARGLSARDRAWVLVIEGEVFRSEGKHDDARTRYDLARMADPTNRLGWHARLRLAQINFDFREFAQVQGDIATLLTQPITADLRAPALLLAGEGAYYAGDYEASITAFRRFLGEFLTHPAAPAATLSIGWAELRRGNDGEARRIFSSVALEQPDNPLAPDALVLAAELAASAGDTATALDLLEQTGDKYPGHPRADIARLNRAILLLRTGKALEAQPLLHDFIRRAPTSPLLGRAHVALGVALLNAKLPAEAREEFSAARSDGEGALAQLGLGTAALALKRWDEAARALGDARDNGTAEITARAEEGLAAVALGRGDRDGFKKAAAVLVKPGRATAALLYALVVSAVDAQAWDDALDSTKRLVKEFPSNPRAEHALARVGLAAAAVKRWATAHEALALLGQNYAQSTFLDLALMPGVEAAIETGATAQARQALEKFVAGSAGDPRLPHAWFLLAQLREEAGQRPGAIEAYTRSAQAGRTDEWTTPVRLRFARLLVEEKRWKDAHGELETIIKGDDTAAATEAAFYQGESYRAEGNTAKAVEYYMTAAYLEPSSPYGRRALLAAAGSYVASKQPDLAIIAYQKLLAQPDLPPDVAEKARAGLTSLGVR